MVNKNIVVNGQGTSLKKNGGAGKYAEQIYKGVVDTSLGKDHGFSVYPINFKVADQTILTSSSANLSLSHVLKHAIYRTCPPVIFDGLQNTYTNVNQILNYYTSNLGSTSSDTTQMWSDCSTSTLLHELSNYKTCAEIGRVSLSPQLSLAVTFLDIQDFFFPEYFQDATLKRRRMAYSFYKDRADVYFAISEFTKQSMVEMLGIQSSKIKVTHLAADDLLVLEPSPAIQKWAKSFGRYLLYPAKLWKHKNHDFLFRTLSKRSQELKNAGIKLLLTGGFDQDDTKYLGSMIAENNLEGIIEVLGFVSDEQLQALLREAEFLVFPSLFEGFGMPILEAMTLGCPVLSSNAGSLPEIGGDAAMYFDPQNDDEFIAIVDLLCGGGVVERSLMIRNGIENCKRFSWENTVNETVKVYKDLLH